MKSKIVIVENALENAESKRSEHNQAKRAFNNLFMKMTLLMESEGLSIVDAAVALVEEFDVDLRSFKSLLNRTNKEKLKIALAKKWFLVERGVITEARMQKSIDYLKSKECE